MWGVPIPDALAEFLDDQANYRVTISVTGSAVIGKKIQLDIVWRGDWKTMEVKPAKPAAR
jgi:hypothetical protein